MEQAWLGSMSRSSASGLRQKDNGVCLLTAHAIEFAVSEERLSGVKHDANSRRSLAAAHAHASLHNLEIGLPYLSSCTQPLGSALDFPITYNTNPVPHHLSHALTAHALSPFDESIVIVMDAGGDLLSPPRSTAEWWTAEREQTSVWIGGRGLPRLIGYEHASPFDIGFGEWFRAFTYFFGWPSHTLTGNTMALASFGDDRFLSLTTLWEDPSGRMGGRLQNSPLTPIRMVEDLLAVLGLEIPPRLNLLEPLTPLHCALARYLQHSFTDRLRRLVESYRRRLGIRNVCLGGGVAQNCVAAAVIASEIGAKRLFVPLSAGDLGQPLGNALYGHMLDTGRETAKFPEDPYLGPTHVELQNESVGGPADQVAALLAQGDIVAIVEGRSEFGPRALGHRSVLCDPCNSKAVSRVKRGVKQREDFMPLAPILLPEVLAPYPGLPSSRTMTVAPVIPEDLAEEFGETRHVDGTSRIQVSPEGAFVTRVLSEFAAITGRRVLVNTSFNNRGKPIIESSDDARTALQSLDVDWLVLGGRLLSKSSHRE